MGRLVGFSIAIAAAGLAMTVAGWKTDDADNVFYQFRWFGPVILGLGAVLTALSIYLARRRRRMDAVNAAPINPPPPPTHRSWPRALAGFAAYPLLFAPFWRRSWLHR